VELEKNTVDAAVALADDWRDWLVDFTRRLVAIPSENPPGHAYGDCVDLLSSELTALGFEPRVTTFSPVDGEPRHVLTAGFGEGSTLYLHGHYDVVPAQDPSQFEAALDGDRIRGRGASDMKGGLASMVASLAIVRELGLARLGRVELVVVPDEETGGEWGSGALSRSGQLGRGGVGMILGEPTSGVIWNGNRGAITLRIRFRGRSAHVGLQHEGANAFEAAVPVIEGLMAVKREVEHRRTALAVEPEAAQRSILMLGGDIAGGSHFNVVPSEFSFTVERRFNPEEDLETERARLLDVIHGASTPGVTVEVETLQEGGSSQAAEDSVPARALAAAVRAVTDTVPRFELCPGLLETRFYDELGVPALAYGPGELSSSHGPHEFVEVPRVVECAAIYALTAAAALGGGGDAGP
jgi:acetylornithine deacetylase/succinyl-diaminopimelate desuccinylase family protein